MWRVLESKKAQKQLSKAPREIQEAYQIWRELVITSGPHSLAQFPGFNDHALQGEWRGSRSSYLNRKWRVIYSVQKNEVTVFVLRVTPHDYQRE